MTSFIVTSTLLRCLEPSPQCLRGMPVFGIIMALYNFQLSGKKMYLFHWTNPTKKGTNASPFQTRAEQMKHPSRREKSLGCKWVDPHAPGTCWHRHPAGCCAHLPTSRPLFHVAPLSLFERLGSDVRRSYATRLMPTSQRVMETISVNTLSMGEYH